MGAVAVAGCAALTAALAPDIGPVFNAFRAKPSTQPLYPVRVDLSPGEAKGGTAGAVGSSRATTSPGAGDNNGTIAQASGPEPGSPLLTEDAAGRGDGRRGPVDLMALDFDISPDAGARSSPGGSQVDTSKPFSLNGVEAGSIDLRVGRDSRIYLERAGLAEALRAIGDPTGERLVAGSDQSAFVSLDDLRSQGLSVRYDPVGDRISLER